MPFECTLGVLLLSSSNSSNNFFLSATMGKTHSDLIFITISVVLANLALILKSHIVTFCVAIYS